VICGYY